MGNKIATLLVSKYKNKKNKNHKKLKKLVLSKPAAITFEIPQQDDDDDDDDDEVYLTPKSSQEEQQEDNDNDDVIPVLEIGQSSSSPSNAETDIPTFDCEICIEPRPLYHSLNVKDCCHFYCRQCIVNYVASKLDDNVTIISCPVSGCGGVLEPEYCRFIIPEDLFDRWGIALCESVIVGSQKFYCPFKDCSVLLINDGGGGITDSECPNCRRVFCVQCKAPWHPDFDCAKYQKLMKHGEDTVLMDLAKRKKWKRCPKCKYYVDKTVGCFYIKCRCGYAFCYNCGATSSTTSHVCPKCKH